ncbi:MAG: phosphoribosylformylglycinamidine synthase, partial [Oscillospiraceae bacterium]|nr:phosphoribosylformylglycinamidine synthase [Oscillospiraceae bacterium]
MANLIRVFVEKRQGFDVEAQALLADLRDNLGIKSIRRLRLLARYDVEGLTPPEFARAKEIVFSEPNVDTGYEEDFPAGEGCRLLITEYLPGQFDLRADSAAQCIQLLIGGELPKVAAARVTVFEGGLSDKDMARIKKYLINPVESREASPDKPESLGLTAPPPPPVARVDGFIGWDTEELEQYRQAESYAMSREDMAFCQRYFKEEEQRNPTLTELKVIDIYWSDHCRHSTFLTRLESVEIEQNAYSEAVTDAIQQALDAYHAARQEVYSDRIGQKDVSLMDMATMGMRLMKKRGQIPDLDESEEINACSVRVPVIIQGDDGESYTEDWLVQFKNETHNHPTEIEPFGGAATCLGGAIRDPLSGRAYVYQAMRVTGSGDPRQPLDKTLPGKLPARKITTGAAAGYSSYGNQIGIAAGQITEIYDPGYTAKRMELGAV